MRTHAAIIDHPKNNDVTTTFTHQYVLKAIQKQNVFVKILSAPPDSDRCLNFVLDQLAHPSTFRPVKPLSNVDRNRFFDPAKGQWFSRKMLGERGQPKNTLYTKKTCVSLLPGDGVMKFFSPKHGYSVGLIIDSRLCHLKGEKYIFGQDANTDSKWWLKRQDKNESEQAVIRSLTLNELKQQLATLRKNNMIPEWNDIQVGLSQASVIGIFALQNTLQDRLRAIFVQQQIKNTLRKDLPIFIINLNGIRVYAKDEQERDVQVTPSALSSTTIKKIN